MNWLNDVSDCYHLGLNTFLPCRCLRAELILILDADKLQYMTT